MGAEIPGVLLGLLGLMLAGTAAAQPVEPPPDDPGEREVSPATPPDSPEATDDPRRRLFLGPQPDRSRAPVSGSAERPPTPILVGPWLPEGSIDLPESLAGAAPPDAEADAPPAATPDEADAAMAEDIAVDSLASLDPAAVGVWSEEDAPALPVGMWDGTPRATLEALLPALPLATHSPVLRQLGRRLLLSPARVPEGGGDEDGVDLLAVRLGRLAAGGALDDLMALATRLPETRAGGEIARLRADAALVLGDYAGACEIAREAIAATGAGFWLRIVAMCEALDGNRGGTLFRLGLLEEAGEADATFGRLVEALLGEIEGRAPVTPAPLPEEARLDPLMFSLARLTRAGISAGAARGAPPLVLVALVELADLDPDIRLAAAERALRGGMLPPDTLASILDSLPFTEEELAAADRLDAEPTAGQAADIAPDAGLAPEPDAAAAPPPPEGLRREALMYRRAVAAGSPEARAWWIERAFESARERGLAVALAPALDGPLGAIEPSATGTLLPAGFAAVAGRIALLAGNTGRALAWYEAARLAAAGGDSAATGALIALWPLIVVSDGSGTVPFSERLLDLWWQGRATLPVEERLRRGDLLFALLGALGHEIPPALAREAVAAPAREAASPGIGLWRGLILAAAAGRTGEAVLSVAVGHGERGPAGTSPAFIAASTGALTALDLGNEARRLALEALIDAGF